MSHLPVRISMVAGALLLAASAFSQFTGTLTKPSPSPWGVEIDALVKEGKDKNQVMKTLHELTNKIGPRLTGSPGLFRAQQWAMNKFKSYGLTNVKLEKWGEVPVGFERGPRQIGRMVAPFGSDFVFTTMNWTEGTKGMVRGKAVRAPKDMAEFEKVKDQLKGAWVIMDAPSSMRGASVPESDVQKAISASGLAGRIFGARDERVHSSGRFVGKTYENRSPEVTVFVRKSDYDRITRNIDFGRETVLEFDIENRFIKGPVPQYNVVAEIKGSEKPDEVVIVCGHLDSWNSPGSQGACDNGTGSSVAIEAARIIQAAKVKPKRTIRFILWSGEEQGLLGSRAYVDQHKDELEKISAVLNDDGGTNYQGGYEGVAAMKEMMEAAFAPTVAAFPDLPMEYRTLPRMPSGGSSDHAPFNMVGVPGFFTMEKGRADYGFVWHTQHDRYEYAIPEYLVQSSTNHAVVAVSLANAPTLLPRAPRPAGGERLAYRQFTPDPIGADHWYEELHGDHHDHSDDYVMYAVDRANRIYKFITNVRRP